MNKKFIVMAAFAAVFGMSFTACSNDDETPAVKGGNQPAMTRAISFVNYMDDAPITRGLAASLGDIQTDGISVWAFDATKETAITAAADFFMGGPTAGLEHTWDGTNSYYKAASDYFWPEYNLNFVAMTPQSGGGIGTIGISQAAAAGEPAVPSKPVMTVFVDVPLTTESSGSYGSDTQKDIMFASIEGQAPLTSGSAALSFKHGLSQLVFKGGVDAQTTIHKAIVKSIKLVNVASDGTITYTAATDGLAAVINGEGAGQTKTYAANIVNATVTAKIGNADPEDDEAANAISGQADNASGRNYQMMILPQTSVTCTGAGLVDNLSQLSEPTTGTYLLVNADLYANGDNVNKVISSDTDVYIPLESTTWAPNTKYTYTLKFGDNLLHPITFTASIADWTDAAKNIEY
jgi:hypothetical protein